MKTNAEFFKLIDPIGQSLLFILFGYSLDSGISIHIIFLMLIGWQIASCAIHFFIKSSVKLLKNERSLYILTIAIYLPVYIYVTGKLKESFIEVRDARGLARFPAHEIIFTTIGLGIAFWYYIICFREIKWFFKRNNR